MDKKTFFSSKIQNFIILLEKEIPDKINIIAELKEYKTNLNKFILVLGNLTQYCQVTNGKYILPQNLVLEYLNKTYNIEKLKPELLDKVCEYFNMFITVANK